MLHSSTEEIFIMSDSDDEVDNESIKLLKFNNTKRSHYSPVHDNNINRSNKPNHKSTQMFYFTKHYEAKHAIGVKHKKRLEFESRPGISNIISACNTFYHTSEKPLDYGRFIISGKPHAVDKLMIEIREYLDRCQNIHNDNLFI